MSTDQQKENRKKLKPRLERSAKGPGFSGVFLYEPATAQQRERWLALCDLLEKYGSELSSGEQIARVLHREYSIGVSANTLREDLRAINAHYVDGRWVRIPFTDRDTILLLIRTRMHAVVEGLYFSGDIVVMNCNRGSAQWVAHAMRELLIDDVVSILADPDTIWLLCMPKTGKKVHEYLHRIRSAP